MNYLDLFIELTLSEKVIPEWNYTSSIRGIFGRSLKNTFCLQRNIDCNKCSFQDCLYFIIFEKIYQKDKSFHPYILRQVSIDERHNIIKLELKLVGDICEKFPQIIHALLRMQRYSIGIKGERHQIKIKCIYDNQNHIVYEIKEQRINQPDPIKISLEKKSVNKLEIHFITPLRMKYRNKLMREFIWTNFYRSLYERIKFINTYLETDKLNLPPFILHNDVELDKTNLIWQEQYRKSKMQNQKMSFGGLIGKVIISNVDENIYSILKLGEILHSGRQTTFGLGKYKLSILEE